MRVAQSEKEKNRDYLMDPLQPAPGGAIPRFKETSRVFNGVRYFAPILPEGPVQILVLGVAPTPEEADCIISTPEGGYEIKVRPKLLKGPLGTLLDDCISPFPALRASQAGYNVLCPWLLPRTRRYKPNKEELEILKPRLREFVAEVAPQVIVACGKLVFDQLVDFKIKHGDARGLWFDYNGIPLYLAESLVGLVTKPWMLEVMANDFREVNRMVEIRSGIEQKLGIDQMRMRTIDTIPQLEAVVQEWIDGKFKRFSIDGEWSGPNFMDGKLRSFQFAWTERDSCYLRFFDEKGKHYLAETREDYLRVGRVLGRALDAPDVTFVAHQASADTGWLEKWLGIKVIGKVEMDTAFAMQTADEYAPAGLDDLTLRVTTFGRYDQELVLWKRKNPIARGEGYGSVPDRILIPYGQLDVLAVMQAVPVLEKKLKQQDLLDYYRKHLNPFVTDVFHGWSTHGLPVDRRIFEGVRKFMNWAYAELLKDFRAEMARQADEKLCEFCNPEVVSQAAELRAVNRLEDAVTEIRKSGDPPDVLLEHWRNALTFNIRSGPQMRVWLFDVMQLTPVKTTKGGESGIPQMLWEKVQELPESLKAKAVPATDKETLEILSVHDTSGMLLRWLAVSNVGNQCKGFLKEGEYDQEGELVTENGLAQFLCSDDRIHPLYALTETTRPRSFLPNVLNLSARHNQGVVAGLVRVLEDKGGVPPEFEHLFVDEDGNLPDLSFKELVKKQAPSVRSVVTAPAGWCFAESDYKTAEIRGQAFIFGDHNLIKLITGHDEDFGIAFGKPVRIRWSDACPVRYEWRKPQFLFTIWEDNKPAQMVRPSDLLRHDGKIVHPSYDLHWLLAELVAGKPREMLDKNLHRGGAKITGFSAAYGAVAPTIERRIEALTGIKPYEGMGQELLDALDKRQPVANQMLSDISEYPARGIPLRAASGRLRRFPIHSSELRGMPWRVKKAYLRAMGNEARNFYLQESVAATLAKACVGLRGFFERTGMRARNIIGLYDANLSMCPLEERFLVAEAHTLFMQDVVCWHYHGRWMNYPIDTDFVYRWSWKPSDKHKDLLNDPDYCPPDKAFASRITGEINRIRDTFHALQPHIRETLNKP